MLSYGITGFNCTWFFILPQFLPAFIWIIRYFLRGLERWALGAGDQQWYVLTSGVLLPGEISSAPREKRLLPENPFPLRFIYKSSSQRVILFSSEVTQVILQRSAVICRPIWLLPVCSCSQRIIESSRWTIFLYELLVTQMSSCTGCAEAALQPNPHVHRQSAIVIFFRQANAGQKIVCNSPLLRGIKF